MPLEDTFADGSSNLFPRGIPPAAIARGQSSAAKGRATGAHMPRDRDKSLQSDDITLAICLRLHDANPWVRARLAELRGHFDPAPRVLVVDFGSTIPHSTELEELCANAGFDYVHVKDYGVYSAAAARNAAAEHAQTSLIFFMDIDFIAHRNLFAELALAAQAADMPRVFDTIIDLPAYHLSQSMTQAIEALDKPHQRDMCLRQYFHSGFFSSFSKEFEFVAPYSNCFLVTRDYFNLLGGYDEIFRGHGSEDFEFFVRAALVSGYFPMPEKPSADFYGPLKGSFFSNKPYIGFRRLNELFCMRAQRAGLRVFHLWHPTSQGGNDWRGQNDWKRTRLGNAFARYLENPERVLQVDHMRRDKVAACICVSPEHWGYFINLRLEGYRLVPIYRNIRTSAAKLEDMIRNGEIDALAIFNPYMKSHREFRAAFDLARSCGVETIVIERGALPGTIYYAEDVAYAGGTFSAESLEAISVTDDEMAAARQYVDQLRTGNHLLEDASTRSETEARLAACMPLARRTVFLPLQLDDDMAVTQFVKPYIPYADFLGSIHSVCKANADTLFVIKPHPLSKIDPESLPENVMVAQRSDNIHALLDHCDAVICYNSGVGLLAACHGKPLITIGNAFYNLPGIGHRAASFQAAVAMVLKGSMAPSESRVTELIAKFLFHRYSLFTADDDIREFETRKAHGYRNIRVSRSIITGQRRDIVWERSLRTFSWRSFGAAELNPRSEIEDLRENELQLEASDIDRRISSRLTFRVYAGLYSLALTPSERLRLKQTPTEFFSRARHPISLLGRRLFN